MREYAKFWIEPQLDNLELLRATYITYAFAPHLHETFAIGVTEVGAQEFTYRRRQRLIMPMGSIAVVSPGEVHTSKAASTGGWTYRMFYPDPSLLQRITSEISDRQQDIPFFRSPVIFDAEVAQYIRNLHMALEDPSTTCLEREARLIWTLSQLVMRHADTRPLARQMKRDQPPVRRVQELLNQRYAENVSLSELASYANLSAFHLLRVFRDVVGLPPHAYQVQLRVIHAKRLLLAGMPIAEVAVLTGFADQSHLSRHFKRTLGVTPGQYQHHSKNVQDR
jgi:AraC-like DNA-binding protein